MLSLSIYRMVTKVVHPFLPAYLNQRARKGKEDPFRMSERCAKTDLPRPPSPLIWIHAASMGESQSVLPIIQYWTETYPTLHILLTTITVTSAKHIASRLPERAFHQYAPLDTPRIVKRFLKHWKPDMACFVDSELWPNTLIALSTAQTPTVLLNGRISDRSMRRWKRALPLCQHLLGCFTHLFAKSDADALRFGALGAKNPVSFGNIKFSAPPLMADATVLEALQQDIGNRPVWLAASTHAGEEQMIGEIHTALKRTIPNVLTIIVPRHATRGDEVSILLSDMSHRVAQRTHHTPIMPETDIYVADTMGELGTFYRLAPLVFVGGSLVPHGGQNPLEPARLDCAITYGLHMHNFLEFCAELEQADAALPVRDATELCNVIARLLTHPTQQATFATAAHAVSEKNKHVIPNICSALKTDVEKIVVS